MKKFLHSVWSSGVILLLTISGPASTALYSHQTINQDTELFGSAAQAQEAPSVDPAAESVPTIPEAVTAPGTVSCFDYYRFGSVTADLQPQVTTAASGTDIVFSGQVVNENEYPVIDGSLYVKVFKEDLAAEKNTAGPDVVDQFFAATDITLPARGARDVQFSWQIPAHLPTGDYKVATFFASANKFNLLGLSFTDDIIGNSAPFSVIGEASEMVHFNKPATTVNNAAYHFAAYPPRVEAGTATVTATLVNPTNKTVLTPVTWQLYSWDALHADNLLDTTQELVTLKPNSTTIVTYATDHSEYPVYLAVATAAANDTKSIIGVRFVRPEVPRVRLNFPAVTDFPLVAGQTTTLFSCLHGMNEQPIVANNELVLTLTDEAGQEFHRYTYTGDVSGAMMAVSDTVTPKQDYDRFTLNATLTQEGELVDSATLDYDCADIDPSACRNPQALTTKETTTPTSTWSVALIALLGLGLLTLLFLMIRRKRSAPTILVLLSVVALGALAVPNAADAKSVQWNTVVQDRLDYNIVAFKSALDPLITVVDAWLGALSNPNISINYHATITNQDTGTIIKAGDVIPAGTNVRFTFRPHHFTDISWFGTGYNTDSPYGDWIANAQAPSPEGQLITMGNLGKTGSPVLTLAIDSYRTTNQCTNKDFIGTNAFHFALFTPLAVNPPTKTLTGTDSLSCGALTNGVMDCVATTPGAVTGDFVFKSTFGKFYYRDRKAAQEPYNTCFGNNTPMRLNSTGLEFTLQVPEQTIPFTFTVDAPIQTNNPPATPTISGPIEGVVDTDYTFTATATDPDGDTIRYGVDWTGDGVVNEWVPATTMVASGTAQDFTRRWSTIGTKTFQVLAQDEAGAVSGWVSHSITLTANIPPPPPVPPQPPTSGIDAPNYVYIGTAVRAVSTSRAHLTAPWQNQTNPLDVNNDGSVSSIDAIQIFNQLQGTSVQLPTLLPVTGNNTLPTEPPPYLDVNGDGWGTTADAVAVQNAINSGQTTGEELACCNDLDQAWTVTALSNGADITPANNTAQEITFTPAVVGQYLITLTVWDPANDSLSDQAEHVVTVLDRATLAVCPGPYLDVDGNGLVETADTKAVIAYMNSRDVGGTPTVPPATGAAYQNPDNAVDVNEDGSVTSIDSVIIINYLNAGGSPTTPTSLDPVCTSITDTNPPPTCPAPYLDVNGDGWVTALDLLVILNHDNGSNTEPIPITGASWQNQTNPLDVNGDGSAVDPVDIQNLISYINAGHKSDIGIHSCVSQPPPLPPTCPAPFYDVNGDGHVSPIDILIVSDYLRYGTTEAIPVVEAALWQNSTNPRDVSGDGGVSSIDMLQLSNYFSAGHPSALPDASSCATSTPTPTPTATPTQTFNPGIIREID